MTENDAITQSVVNELNTSIGGIDYYEFVKFKIKGYDTHAIQSLIDARNEMVIEDKEEDEDEDKSDERILTDFNGNTIKIQPIYCYGSGNLKIVPHDFDSYKDALSSTMMAEHFMSHFDYVVATTIDNSFYVYFKNRWYDESSKDQTAIKTFVKYCLFDILWVYIDDNYVPINDDSKISKGKLWEILRVSCDSGCVAIVKNIMALTRSKQPQTFDNNKTLLGFENGVYDLKEGIFRLYEYDDFITRSTGYNYEPLDLEDKDTTDKLKLMETILSQIMPFDSNRDFLLRIMAANLNGINSQRVFFFNGSGGNGKGMLQSLNKYVLGLGDTSGYFCKAKNQALEQMGSTGSANEDIFSMNLRRCVVFSEIKVISGDILKGLSGDNTLSARPLFGSNRTICLDANIICEFNRPPQLGHLDGGLLRRIIYIDFPSKFCDEASYDKLTKAGRPHIFKGNEDYVKEPFCQGMKLVWLHMLLQYYNSNKETDGSISFSRVPRNIVIDTEKYVLSEDVIGTAFYSVFELFTPSDDKKVYLTFKEVKSVVLEDDAVKAKRTTSKELEKWLTEKYGSGILETPMRGVTDQYRKKLCVINVRYIVGDGDDVEEKDDEYMIYEPDIAEIGVTMADADAESTTQTMTDSNGRKIVLSRKAPK